MNTNKITGAQISAFADGELDPAEHEEILAALRQPEAHSIWNEYHHIGDVLRSNDSAGVLSPDFGTRMAAAIAAEATYFCTMPTRSVHAAPSAKRAQARLAMRRIYIPGAAVAAAVILSVAIVTRPDSIDGNSGEMLAPSGKVVLSVASDGSMARDSRIDSYLQAHQRFTPSVYSTAQYARTTTFSTEADQ